VFYIPDEKDMRDESRSGERLIVKNATIKNKKID
jgi:hypothetical protein